MKKRIKMTVGFLLASLLILLLLFVAFPPGRDLVGFLAWRSFQAHNYTQGNVASGQALIHYQTFGSGTPIVLLHGGATQSEIFLNQIPPLSKAFRVIAIDSRGQGRSTRGSRPLTYRVMATDVITVLDALGLEKAHILGWSDGGITGLVLAVDHPERIASLVAVSANYSPAGIQSDDGQYRISPPGLLARLVYWFYSPQPERWETLSRELTQLWATLPELELGELSKIENPVLLIAGEHDLVSIPHLQEMQRAIKGSKLVIVKDADHSLLIGYGQEINEAVLDFLKPRDGD